MDDTERMKYTEYIAVALEEKDKNSTIDEIMISVESVQGLSSDEVAQHALRFYQRLQTAQQILDQLEIEGAVKMQGPELVERMIPFATTIFALNVLIEWSKRAQHDPSELQYLEVLKNPEAEREALRRASTLLEKTVSNHLMKPKSAKVFHSWVWQHLIAGILQDLEEEHDAETQEELLERLGQRLGNTQVVTSAIKRLLLLYAQDIAKDWLEVLDPENRPLPELRLLMGLGGKTEGTGAIGDFVAIPSGGAFYALQEVIATQGFHKDENSPWPTAFINRGGAKGTAQLRPASMDESPVMAPDEVSALAKLMWKTRNQLSDLDVDIMDALAAMYLRQTSKPGEDAVASIDDILAMRGLAPKAGGQGRRGGYTQKQRQEVQAALARIQSVWLDMAEVDTYEETTKGGRRRTRTSIQSRPFVITDRMGQVRLDGYMDVERFIFRPGRVFAHYLHGPGRQTALLNAKILELDHYRATWEKRLGRYLTNLWRIRAHKGTYMEPLRIRTLMEAVGDDLDSSRGARHRERFEAALDNLTDHEIINGWQYEQWDEDTAQQRRWFDAWLQATVRIEPPDKIEEHYLPLEKPTKANTTPQEPEGNETLATRLAAKRKQLDLTQLQVAEQLDISQVYFSRLERGKASPSPKLQQRIQAWLNNT